MEQDPLEKILQVKCTLHSNNQSDILHIAGDISSHRACIKCVLNGNVSYLAALDLRTLFQMADDEDRILNFYPPLNNQKIFKQLESIQQYSVDNSIEKIEQFIKDLKLSFDEIFDKLKKKSIRSIEELGRQRQQVLDVYNSLCESTKLKQAVLHASESKEDTRLHELITEKWKYAMINESKLQSVIGQFQENLDKFTMRIANESSENILNIMRNISFFNQEITTLVPSYSMLSEFQLVSNNKYDSISRTLISKKENNQIDMKCVQDNGNVCSLNSHDVLDNNAHYIFRFIFHQESRKGSPKFYIGLENSDDKIKTSNFNCIRYMENSDFCEINKIIKGCSLKSPYNAKNLHKEVEMRVHLASQTIKVADYPNYNNVVELTDKTLIREGCQYYLLVELGYLNNHITLNDVIVTDKFDDFM